MFLYQFGGYGGALMLYQFRAVPSTEHSIFITRDKDRLPALLPPQYTQLVNVNCMHSCTLCCFYNLYTQMSKKLLDFTK